VVNNQDSEENYASVGFEDPSETVGLQYSYDNTYVTTAATLMTGRAIKITTNTGGGGIRGMVTLQGAEHGGGVVVTANGGQYRTTDADGSYWIKNIPPGFVDLTAELEGYFPMTMDSVEVLADQSVSGIDFSMTTCPVPVNLHASDSLDYVVELTWDAITHDDFAGYNLYRSRWQDGQYIKLNIQPLQSPNFVDATVADSNVYWYYVVALYSGDGWNANSTPSVKESGHVLTVTGVTEEGNQIPKQFFLAQNYPNPFNPTTSISYGLPNDAHVSIEVFNLLGQRVRVLVNEDQSAGYKRIAWDGKDNVGKAVASGTYLYRLKAGDKESTMKMLMLK
jgi:hypothetical protein